MTKQEIQTGWQCAETLVGIIVNAYVNGVDIEGGRKAQAMLAQWLDVVKREGIVYNGNYDEYLTYKL